MSELTVRSLQSGDLDRVAAIESRIAGQPRRGFLEKRFSDAAVDPENHLACGVTDLDQLKGYAFARLQTGAFATRDAVAVLDVIGVDPAAQGQGIGKLLMREIEARLLARAIGRLKTQVEWANHGMVQFFASHGFRLSPFQVIERDTAPLDEKVSATIHGQGDHEGDPSDLSRDRVPVRSLGEADLAEVVRLDRKLTGRDRSTYYSAKFREMLAGAGIRVSLVAEAEGALTGFIMARVDFGEFGKVERTAVMDAIGVHPAFTGYGIGHALLSQLLLNLSTLQVDFVRTQVSPENLDLSRFLHACGFHQSQQLVLIKTIPS